MLSHNFHIPVIKDQIVSLEIKLSTHHFSYIRLKSRLCDFFRAHQIIFYGGPFVGSD